MSSQGELGVSCFYAREQRGFRLLELPPELVDLVSSGQPFRLAQSKTVHFVTKQRLTFTSLELKSASTAARADTPAEPAHAVLCTENTTYQLRQVQTSNTVLITESQPLRDGRNASSKPGLSAIATCSSTLEVYAQAPSASLKVKSPATRLKEMLPVYHAPDDFDRFNMKSKASIFSDIPFSEDECKEAWLAEVAFERQGGSWIPAVEVLLELWNTLLEDTSIHIDNVTQPFQLASIKASLEVADSPKELLDAFLRCIVHPNQQPLGADHLVILDKTRTITLLGKICVGLSIIEQHDSAVWQVLEMWQKLVPEPWRAELTIKDVMAVRTKFQAAAANEAQDGALEDQKMAAKTSASRNWHERFKRTKR